MSHLHGAVAAAAQRASGNLRTGLATASQAAKSRHLTTATTPPVAEESPAVDDAPELTDDEIIEAWAKLQDELEEMEKDSEAGSTYRIISFAEARV
jgi:hypothetical protein